MRFTIFFFNAASAFFSAFASFFAVSSSSFVCASKLSVPSFAWSASDVHQSRCAGLEYAFKWATQQREDRSVTCDHRLTRDAKHLLSSICRTVADVPSAAIPCIALYASQIHSIQREMCRLYAGRWLAMGGGDEVRKIPPQYKIWMGATGWEGPGSADAMVLACKEYSSELRQEFEQSKKGCKQTGRPRMQAPRTEG